METFKDRLVFLFGADTRATQIAKAIGMQYAGFTRIWENGVIPKVETMVNIQNATGCDLNWLLTGKGEPFPTQAKKDTPPPDDALSTTFKERLAFLFGADAGPTRISKAIGMKYAGFARVWYDGSTPKVETIINIQNVTGCDLNWLLTGKGEPFPGLVDNNIPPTGGVSGEKAATHIAHHQENKRNVPPAVIYDALGRPVDTSQFVYIPCYHRNGAAGQDGVQPNEQNKLVFAFKRFWVENNLHADPKDLSVIAIRSNSMEGVLNSGDNILINHAKNQPGDGLYVIRIGEALMVKQTQPLPGNKLLVTSANESYESFTLDLAQSADDIEIIGKVEWFGRQL